MATATSVGFGRSFPSPREFCRFGWMLISLQSLWIPNQHFQSSDSMIMMSEHLLLFTHSAMAYFWWPHRLQHARLPCSSPSPRVCLNSCPLGQWCHPTISSSDDPFSSCHQSFPASGSFPMSQLFASGDKVLELQSFQWIFRVDSLLDGLVWSPCSPRDSQESSALQFESINS